jgi:hypothetical protein
VPEGQAIVSGVVRGRGGSAVEGARVFFAGGPGSLPDVAALTDASGAFTLSAPAAGLYRVRCVADGYSPGDVEVTLEAGGTQRVTVTLSAAG